MHRSTGPIAAVFFAALVRLLAAPAGAELPVVRIGVVVDGPWERNDYIKELTEREVRALTQGEFDVRFPSDAYLIGDWSYERATFNLERLLEDPEVDLVLTWGVLASHAVCCFGDPSKPVIAPVVLDPVLQGLPLADGVSGVRNLSYVELENRLGQELTTFRRIVPFTRVHVLTTPGFLAAIPGLETRNRELASEAGFQLVPVPVYDTAEEALAAIPDDAEAVYVWPQFQLSAAERQQLIDGLNERRLPSFAGLDTGEVEAGMLASATSEDFFPRLSRRVALNVQRILLGEEPGSIPVLFRDRLDVRINMETARRIGVSPGWDILIEADLLHPEASGLPVMSLERAVSEAIEANLDLAAQRRQVAAGEQEVELARADRRPRLDLAAGGALIDDDRAEASFGARAERSTTASLSLDQLLFAEPVNANVTVQEELQRARLEELEALRLDIALDAAVTYLNLLRAGSLVEVQRNNLELTRENLELAEVRRSIGAANPAEVYRWESQVATDRKALIEAMADERAAEVALNRLLHRDLEARFVAREVELDDPDLITGQERFEGYTDTPARFRVLRDFMVQEGLTVAPELRRLDASIAARERALRAARRAYWAPSVGLRATLERILSEGGAGSTAPDLGPAPSAFPVPDDTSWSLGVSGSLPLWSGGSRRAEVLRAEEELAQLQHLFDATAERIATRIRVGMEVARASFAGIELSRQAADAASRSRELVADAYARGAVSTIELLDAQAAELNAEQLLANAVYDFFIDLMEVQRAANRFDFFLTVEERELWYERLEEFFERRGAEPLKREGSAESAEREPVR